MLRIHNTDLKSGVDRSVKKLSAFLAQEIETRMEQVKSGLDGSAKKIPYEV
jgi:hypothetical protein